MIDNRERLIRAFSNRYNRRTTMLGRPVPVTAEELADIALGAIAVEVPLPQSPSTLDYPREHSAAMIQALDKIAYIVECTTWDEEALLDIQNIIDNLREKDYLA